MSSFRQAFKDQTTLYVFVAVLFLVGVLFGALMVNALSLEQQQEMARYLNHFFVNVQDGGEAMSQSSYWSIAALHLKWIGLIWILGLSVIGLPGILILDFLKGVLIGFTVGYLVGQYSWKGLLFALVSIAPQNLLIIPVLMMCSVAAITFSLYIIRDRFIMNRGGSMMKPFASYALLTFCMVLLTLGVASFETWVTPVMMRWVTPMLL
ncbi:stage II sporulation protein M [Paenibacillus vortex V453]|jgi:stage II sporulation protein M|uniref:Stage II sporulation protein M n=2 Tax=Paenibacillus TaxID=44249 RepID=A0A163LDB4_9BACL|nr:MULTISPECIES: stage II sporulation protein M [Paenibacillus]ANA81978.1 stage II sporulation protein M [Paenibacillus glucanolyticus]AVV59286.1 stage II sporulation protein M [Paenibacillus glucanolyticus]AWP28457.1 stage II sporulation protein M [Paenibacillus sp. Cedars]EFU41323.1 stage II sporulation protein M [Paenibacillus vortex V453]ETT43410.1 stage II sporulation protein M [Paenibacillus sp. FSL R5-808]